MSPGAYIVAAAIGAVVCTGAGWRLGIDHMKAKASDEDKVRQETREAAQQGAADAIAKASADNTKVVTRIKTVTREVPVYRSAECQHDDRVFNDLNDALSGKPAGESVVPAGSGGAVGQELRDDSGKAR